MVISNSLLELLITSSWDLGLGQSQENIKYVANFCYNFELESMSWFPNKHFGGNRRVEGITLHLEIFEMRDISISQWHIVSLVLAGGIWWYTGHHQHT